MRIKEFTLGATIATANYSNLMPSITVEVDDDVEAAKALAISHIASISQRFAEPGKQLVDGSQAIVKDIFGQKIYFDELSHTYTNSKGQVYLSGSQYAKRFESEFNADMIAQKMADKSGVEKQLILDAWKAKADVSAGFGTAIHKALENYAKYKEMASILDKPYDLHDHPIISKCVKEFYKDHEDEVALSEAMVIDHERRLAGTIDRLLLVDKEKKICRIQDFKTNSVLDKKKLEGYAHQLSFYASILQAKGWTIEGLDIFHWNGKWSTHQLDIKEVTV